MALHADRFDVAHRGVVHLHGGVGHQVLDVVELHVHGVGIAAIGDGPGQRERIDTAEFAAGRPDEHQGNYGNQPAGAGGVHLPTPSRPARDFAGSTGWLVDSCFN